MKFLYSRFEYDGGVTTVVMEHMGKEFSGKAKTHPDDMENMSEIMGGKIAEARATIKALKYERQIEKEKCEECRKFLKACQGYKNFDKESPTARAMFRQLNQRIKAVNRITDQINTIYKGIEKSIWDRDITIKALKAKKGQK